MLVVTAIFANINFLYETGMIRLLFNVSSEYSRFIKNPPKKVIKNGGDCFLETFCRRNLLSDSGDADYCTFYLEKKSFFGRNLRSIRLWILWHFSMRSGFAVIKGRLHRNSKVKGAGTFNSIIENTRLTTA